LNLGIEQAAIGILLGQGGGGKMVRKQREQKDGVTYRGADLPVIRRQASWEMAIKQEAGRKMRGSEVKHDRMAVRKKSQMEHSQMESNRL